MAPKKNTAAMGKKNLLTKNEVLYSAVPGACCFCNRTENDERTYGKFLDKDGIKVHNFCMLFASGLSQNGEDDEDGFLGFLLSDIKKELRRGKRMRCRYCQTHGATVGCTVKSCRSIFHYACGRDNGALHQFFGTYSTYCYDHRPYQKCSKETISISECPICYGSVRCCPSLKTLRGPCCTKVWYHRDCIQQQALTAGLHFFRCPLCNDQQLFRDEMLQHGIYIPDQDAAWETEPDAFRDLLECYSRCDAQVCLCKDASENGRTYNKPEEGWDIIVCCGCGGAGVHSRCGGVRGKTWTCPDCKQIIGKPDTKKISPARGKQEKSPYKASGYPLKGSDKRKDISWQRGNARHVTKKLRLNSPNKTCTSTITLSSLGEPVCGASLQSRINCTASCQLGLHRPRIPKLILDRVDRLLDRPLGSAMTPLRINHGLLYASTPNNSPSCSTRNNVAAPTINQSTSRMQHSLNVEPEPVEQDYVLFMDSCASGASTSSVDDKSATHRNEQQTMTLSGDESENSTTGYYAPSTPALCSPKKLTSFPLWFDKSSDNHRRLTKPKRRMPPNLCGQKSIFNYFQRVKSSNQQGSPGKVVEEKKKPTMSVKPSRSGVSLSDSSEDDFGYLSNPDFEKKTVSCDKSSPCKPELSSMPAPSGGPRRTTARKSTKGRRVSGVLTTAVPGTSSSAVVRTTTESSMDFPTWSMDNMSHSPSDLTDDDSDMEISYADLLRGVGRTKGQGRERRTDSDSDSANESEYVYGDPGVACDDPGVAGDKWRHSGVDVTLQDTRPDVPSCSSDNYHGRSSSLGSRSVRFGDESPDHVGICKDRMVRSVSHDGSLGWRTLTRKPPSNADADLATAVDGSSQQPRVHYSDVENSCPNLVLKRRKRLNKLERRKLLCVADSSSSCPSVSSLSSSSTESIHRLPLATIRPIGVVKPTLPSC